jgi:DNA-binding CsgD family transcriptional regulator
MFTRLRLTPLSREAVQQLAEQKGYNAEDVYSISGGNPFYVSEILASYSPGVPENIKDSILSVYNRQDDITKNCWQLLSVIPEGLELERIIKIDMDWAEAIGNSLAKKILIIKNNKIFFKHELYRRTIENSLSPFKRIDLNKKILDFFMTDFEKKKEIERIVHYAKNANQYDLVVRYAPAAADDAACVGSHLEASRLLYAAIEYSDQADKNNLVKLYEAYAYECYLTNQIKDAIIYEGKVLKIWKEKNDTENIGNSLRFLSRFWWFDGNSEKAEKYGKQAVDILSAEPTSAAKAMAYSNMSQLYMLFEEAEKSVEWGNKAIVMAKEINDQEILSHALNNVGTSQWKIQFLQDEGTKLLFESLAISLKNSFHENAARAYTNIISRAISCKQYNVATKYLEEGLNYCEQRDLDSWTNYKLSWKARMLLEKGEWNEALLIANRLLLNPDQPAVNKIGALIVIGTIKLRKGESDSLHFLEEAKTLAFATREHQRTIPVMIALLEYEWLTGNKIISEDEINASVEIVTKYVHIYINSAFLFWLKKARKLSIKLPELFEPYQYLQDKKTSAAADFWEKLNCPFDRAIALFSGNENDKRNALSIFQQLGADAIAEKIKMEMRSFGIKKIPRGLRSSTKTNPAQLTNRELDVLELLKEGIQNKEIAGSLFISSKTVDHHISNILFKLDVKSRSKAVREAMHLGIIK